MVNGEITLPEYVQDNKGLNAFVRDSSSHGYTFNPDYLCFFRFLARSRVPPLDNLHPHRFTYNYCYTRWSLIFRLVP